MLKSISEKTPAEMQAEVIKMYSAMTPEMFFEHTRNVESMAVNRGRDAERDEIVCRLLANGMSVEEIAVILCVKKEIIRIIESNYAATKIPEYAKKLKERRRRRERQTV
jgi:DNA-binding NarL/FixJ family response regulator